MINGHKRKVAAFEKFKSNRDARRAIRRDWNEFPYHIFIEKV